MDIKKAILLVLIGIFTYSAGAQTRLYQIEPADTANTGDSRATYEDYLVITKLDTFGIDDYRLYYEDTMFYVRYSTDSSKWITLNDTIHIDYPDPAGTYSWDVDTDNEVPLTINSTDVLLLSEGTGMTVARSGNTITFSTTVTDTDSYIDSMRYDALGNDTLWLLRWDGTQWADSVFTVIQAELYSWDVDTDGEAALTINNTDQLLLSEGTGMTVDRVGNTITFATTVADTDTYVDSAFYGADDTLVLVRWDGTQWNDSVKVEIAHTIDTDTYIDSSRYVLGDDTLWLLRWDGTQWADSVFARIPVDHDWYKIEQIMMAGAFVDSIESVIYTLENVVLNRDSLFTGGVELEIHPRQSEEGAGDATELSTIKMYGAEDSTYVQIDAIKFGDYAQMEIVTQSGFIVREYAGLGQFVINNDAPEGSIIVYPTTGELQNKPYGTGNFANNDATYISAWDLDGNVLEISIADLGDSIALSTDHDWYEIDAITGRSSGSAPNAIGDNQFTNGRVVIGEDTIRGSFMLGIQSITNDALLLESSQDDVYAQWNGTNYAWNWRLLNDEFILEDGSVGGTGVYIAVQDGWTSGTAILELQSDGNVVISDYPNTRDDAGNPVNVLTTSATGGVESHPIADLNNGGAFDDADWYVENTASTVPTSSTDNQWHNGNIGIGDFSANTDIDRALDIIAGNAAQFRIANTRADATTKNAYMQVRHYTAAEQDVMIVLAQSLSSSSNLYWGGGSGSLNAVTSQRFYTAADNITLSGTERMRINSDGSFDWFTFGVGTWADTDDAYVITVDGTGNIQEQPYTDLLNVEDHDIYEAQTTAVPDNITDFKYTRGRLGIGDFSGEDPAQALEVIGDLQMENTLTDATNKFSRFVVKNYNNADPSALGFQVSSFNNENYAVFGGSSTIYDAMQRLSFYTEETWGNTIGEEQMRINNIGEIHSYKWFDGVLAQDSANVTRITYPKGGASAVLNGAGAIRIDLPAAVSWPSADVQIFATIREDLDDTQYQLELSGSLAASTWSQSSATVLGTDARQIDSISFGSRQTDVLPSIWLEDTSGSWANATLTITEVLVNGTADDIQDWRNDWAVQLDNITTGDTYQENRNITQILPEAKTDSFLVSNDTLFVGEDGEFVVLPSTPFTGTANRVVFTDATGVLDVDDGFTYNETTDVLQINSSITGSIINIDNVNHATTGGIDIRTVNWGNSHLPFTDGSNYFSGLSTVFRNELNQAKVSIFTDTGTPATEGQVRFHDYVNTTVFAGTEVGVLGYDASGNILTTPFTDLPSNYTWDVNNEFGDDWTVNDGTTVNFIGVGSVSVTGDNTPAGTQSIEISYSDGDASSTNELQDFTNSSTASTHRLTLAASGGDYIEFIEGTNITLTTGGTADRGTVTIDASGSGITSWDFWEDGNNRQAVDVSGEDVHLYSGSGISITWAGSPLGMTISAFDVSGTNELQNLGIGTRTSTTYPITITSGTGATLNTFSSTLAGIVPSSGGGGTTNFLRADGSWAAPGAGSSEWTDAGTYLRPADGAGENVIIGATSSPTGKLEVRGTITAGPDADLADQIQLSGSSNNYGKVGLNAETYILFRSDGTQDMELYADGSLVFDINTTNTNVQSDIEIGNNTGDQLEVVTSSTTALIRHEAVATNFLRFHQSADVTLNVSDGDLDIAVGSGITNFTAGDIVTTTSVDLGIGRTPASHDLEIASNDASKGSAGDWVINSDRRLKRDIEQLDGAEMLNRLLKVKGVRYRWNQASLELGYERDTVPLNWGMIAQDIEEGFGKDQHFILTDPTGYLNAKYGTFDPVYIEIFRHMNDRIKDQEKRIDHLEQQIQSLIKNTKK